MAAAQPRTSCKSLF